MEEMRYGLSPGAAMRGIFGADIVQLLLNRSVSATTLPPSRSARAALAS